MTKKKKQPEPNWDTFNFQTKGRPAIVRHEESESKPDKKEALTEVLKNALGNKK